MLQSNINLVFEKLENSLNVPEGLPQRINWRKVFLFPISLFLFPFFESDCIISDFGSP